METAETGVIVADEVRHHYHPACHLINGERLFYFMIRSNGDFDRTQEQLLTALKDVGLETSSCAYLVFGDYDFIVRFWASQLRCRDFESKLFDLKQRKEVKLWKRLFISSLSTWIQRRIEAKGLMGSQQLSSDEIRSIWKGEPSMHLRLALPARPLLKNPFRFFMFIEESFDTEPKVIRLLRDLLAQPVNADSHAFLKTWSIYSYYVEPQETENIRSERGVLFVGQVESLYSSSDFLVKLPRTLSECAAREEVRRGVLAQSNPEFLYRSVTYICAKEIKGQEGALDVYDEKEHDRKRQILRDLFVSHDNHNYKYLESDNRRKVQDRFIEVALEIKPFEIYLQNILLRHKGLPDWWKVVSDTRLVYKFLVFGRNELFMQLLIKKYIFIETFLLQLCHSITWESHMSKKIMGVVKSTVRENTAVDFEELDGRLRTIFGKQQTLADIPQLINEARRRGIETKQLSDVDGRFLTDFSKAIEALATYRNKIFHGEWKDLIMGDGKPNSEDYYWVPIVRNYLLVSFGLVQAVVYVEKVLDTPK